MSGGIGMVLNTAKLALAAQQVSINVTGNNIANVNTPGYSRQTAIQVNLDAIRLGNNLLGTGVSVDAVVRSSDKMLVARLNDQQSSLSANEQADSYMRVLEGLFNENSETSLSTQLSAFWNSWQALSNSPNGSSERVAVFDTADRLAEQFQWLNENMRQMETDLTEEIDAGVSRVNTLSEQIAAINLDIAHASVTANPNDMLDKRDNLVSELSQLMDIQVFEQGNGMLSILSGSGSTLVYGADSYPIEQQGTRIIAVDATGSGVDMTDRITGGTLGGWLTMRDEVVPKYRNDLDALTEELIWTVNQVHSQGVGLGYFSDTMTGTYKTDNSGMLSTLPFGDRIDASGEFKMWVKDTSVSPATYSNISVDMETSGTTIAAGTGAADSQYRITVVTGGTVGSGATTLSWERYDSAGTLVGSSGATPVAVTAAGTATIGTLGITIGAGDLYSGNTFTVNTDSGGAADNLDVSIPATSGPANSVNDTYVFTAKTAGEVGAGPIEFEWHNGTKAGTFTIEPGAPPEDIVVDGMTLSFDSGTLIAGETFTVGTDASGNATAALSSDWHWSIDSFAVAFNSAADAAAGGGPGSGHVQASVDDENRLVLNPEDGYQYAFGDDQTPDSGMAAALGLNTFFSGYDAANIQVNSLMSQTDYLAAARIDGATGEFAVGDNTNALAIADIQNETRTVNQWTYDRRADSTSTVVSATLEGYYQGMLGSMGIKAESIADNLTFSQTMVEKISEQRDSISGVNLDEEVINLMKFQHAFGAASKLISVADELFQTLLAMK